MPGQGLPWYPRRKKVLGRGAEAKQNCLHSQDGSQPQIKTPFWRTLWTLWEPQWAVLGLRAESGDQLSWSTQTQGLPWTRGLQH